MDSSSQLPQLPVFVFPSSLTFVVAVSGGRSPLDAQRSNIGQNLDLSRKQLLTLYNPYDFSLHFSVLCTSPRRYSVVSPDGTIRPRHAVDIVIRLKEQPQLKNTTSTVLDHFRIRMVKLASGGATASSTASGNECGQRDVPVTVVSSSSLLPDNQSPGTHPKSSAGDTVFTGFPSDSSSDRSSPSGPSPSDQYPLPGRGQSSNGNQLFLIGTAVCCLVALLMPSTLEQGGDYREFWFALSLPQKLVAAYVLGLITMSLFRQHNT